MQARVVGHWTKHLEHVYDALSSRLPNGRIDDVPDYVLNAFVGRDDGLHWIIDQNEVWRAWRWFFEWFNMSVVEFALITEDLLHDKLYDMNAQGGVSGAFQAPKRTVTLNFALNKTVTYLSNLSNSGDTRYFIECYADDTYGAMATIEFTASLQFIDL